MRCTTWTLNFGMGPPLASMGSIELGLLGVVGLQARPDDGVELPRGLHLLLGAKARHDDVDQRERRRPGRRVPEVLDGGRHQSLPLPTAAESSWALRWMRCMRAIVCSIESTTPISVRAARKSIASG